MVAPPKLGKKWASFQIVNDTPEHAIFRIWINGHEAGDLTVRQSDRLAFKGRLLISAFHDKARDAIRKE